MRLHELLDRSVRRDPERVAVETVDGGSLTYEELDRRASEIAAQLGRVGVRAGDRVGLQLPKSPTSVAAIFGVLRAGAAYVPVDASAPVDRNATIFSDCAVRAVVVEAGAWPALQTALGAHTGAATAPEPLAGAAPDEDGAAALVTLAGTAEGDAPTSNTSPNDRSASSASTATAPDARPPVDDLEPAGSPPADGPSPADAAYMLYTSGSTGRPKGVVLSHAAALAFVDWCAETFDVGPEDRVSSHAPFHFDLSILDLYLTLGRGATLVLIDEETGRQPRRLAPVIADKRLTVWYSTPSILSLLVQHGKLERHADAAPRYVLFAGEVFPVRHLRALTEIWPGSRYFNLYGPTETNVCTFHEVTTPIPADRSEPYPIGRACSHLETRVVDGGGDAVVPGAEGELVVRGPAVMDGYWDRPERTAEAFLDIDGGGWYRTGDVVRETDEGYVFVGRRDRMVKRRGYRVELGEIEARLHRHPDLTEVAVVAHPDEDEGVRIEAFVCWRNDERPSLIELKRFCTDHVPASMIPDRFSHRSRLPRTSTDKVDYEELRRT